MKVAIIVAHGVIMVVGVIILYRLRSRETKTGRQSRRWWLRFEDVLSLFVLINLFLMAVEVVALPNDLLSR